MRRYVVNCFCELHHHVTPYAGVALHTVYVMLLHLRTVIGALGMIYMRPVVSELLRG